MVAKNFSRYAAGHDAPPHSRFDSLHASRTSFCAAVLAAAAGMPLSLSRWREHDQRPHTVLYCCLTARTSSTSFARSPSRWRAIAALLGLSPTSMETSTRDTHKEVLEDTTGGCGTASGGCCSLAFRGRCGALWPPHISHPTTRSRACLSRRGGPHTGAGRWACWSESWNTHTYL